ncbi:unnamed protein product [Chondrus crispus]|uniref:DNA-directed RNA polymerases I and III subunit RPAC1 n=1 Tax=Chondrus crispus TaxID=2769 RepID=R7QCA5_CHOCR|nr:unnamed protein product [Chondrus crispus]CDF35709.1 unnamed protein product [Chondrus crispus]|eukprot:XP_005715528.1 unnamed protein product [Chondrus crispus]
MPATIGQLPSHLEKARSRVGVGFKKISNPVGTYGARTYQSLGYDNSLRLNDFKENCTLEILFCDDEEVLFDLVGTDAPIANALRRILLSEVPTLAIENVFVHRNTSIMHDEQLAHRLGLVPLKIDPRPFEYWEKGLPVTVANTVKLSLRTKCEFNPSAPRDGEAPPSVLYKNSSVLSGSIEHVPFGGHEQSKFIGNEVPRPVHEDILLCKLRPGQEIHVEMDATKNIGREHAKWSPVATAGYRMLPEVNLKTRVVGATAKRLVNLCPAKVFDIEDDVAVVARPRDCTVCRECIREPEWEERVELTRKRDHFIFSVESTGAMPAPTLVTEALSVLTGKCDLVLAALDAALKQRTTHDNGVDEENPDVEMDESEGS